MASNRASTLIPSTLIPSTLIPSTLIKDVREAVDRYEARFAELCRDNAAFVRICRIECDLAREACAEWRRSAAMIAPRGRRLDRGEAD